MLQSALSLLPDSVFYFLYLYLIIVAKYFCSDVFHHLLKKCNPTFSFGDQKTLHLGLALSFAVLQVAIQDLSCVNTRTVPVNSGILRERSIISVGLHSFCPDQGYIEYRWIGLKCRKGLCSSVWAVLLQFWI